MKVVLLQVGKTSEKYLNEGILSYGERIKRYVPFETITIPDIRNTRNMPASEQKTKEGERIIEVLKDDDLAVVLDEKGKELSTIDFSSWLEKNLMLQKKRLIFIIGGPWGVSDKVLLRADHKFSLSRMTFSHQIVRLLFLEQLYRAFTVIRGEPYHHI
jgi:23S rRNA (pseudouridine1915-N3)-methyltransferase